MELQEDTGDEVLRERAIRRLKKRRDFMGHLLVYVLVNSFIVLIWAMTGADGFFWPIFPIVGWGIGVVMNGWDVYRNDGFDETQIRREMDRLQQIGGRTP
jgi:2TM domain-containing protein